MKINEIFYSIQGEGARSGQASIFIRLTGCDLACGFCDTEFESGKEMSDEELLETISKSFVGGCKWIVWTGGEPTLQLKPESIAFFKENGYKQAIETNGNNLVPEEIDWVACSPKVAEHILLRNFPNGVDELRYVRHKGHMSVPNPKITAKRKFLSPMFDGDKPNVANILHCTKLVLENPEWELSVQSHKLLKVL